LPFVFALTTGAQILANATLTQAWVPRKSFAYSVNSVSWTLSVELFFYALFPCVAFALRRHPVILALSLFTGATVYFVIFDTRDAAAAISHFGICPLARLPEFILGMVVGEIALNRSTWYSLIGTGAEIAILVITVTANWCMGYLPNLVWPVGGMSATVWLDNVGCAPFFAALIFVYAISAGEIARVLSLPTFVFMGEISFGFYLFHPLGIRIAGHLSGPVWQVVAAFTLTVSMATGSYLAFERPLMGLARRSCNSRQPSNVLRERYGDFDPAYIRDGLR